MCITRNAVYVCAESMVHGYYEYKTVWENPVLAQEIFNEEMGIIIDRITPLNSLFLGSTELRLSSNIDSVIYPLWDKSFTEI